jgi:hypothetical protein
MSAVPLVADLSISGTVIVGFADGRATAFSWLDLNQSEPEDGVVPLGEHGIDLLERLSYD